MERNVPKLRFKGFNDEWKEIKLGEFLTFYSTNSFSRDCLNYENGDVQNIHYGDIHMKFSTILDTEKYSIPYINSDINITKYSEDSYCKDGDLVIADASEDYDDIGKSIEVCNIGNKRILAGLHTILARDNKQQTVNGFKGYMMQSESVRKQVKVLAAGAKVLGISKSNLEKVNVKLPSLQEQERIANFLTKVDKIIEKQDEKVKNLEKYKKGMMQKIFSQEIRFKDENGEEYPEWEEKKIGNITKITDGVHFTPEYVDNGIPFWSVETIVSGANPKFITREAHNLAIKRCHPEKNDILITRIGSLAKSKVISSNEELSIYVSVALIKASDKFNSKFMKQYFDSEIYLKEFLSKSLLTATPKKINMEDLKTTKVILPCLEEQRKIAKVLSNIDLILEKQNMKLEELREWKKGLLQNMFV